MRRPGSTPGGFKGQKINTGDRLIAMRARTSDADATAEDLAVGAALLLQEPRLAGRTDRAASRNAIVTQRGSVHSRSCREPRGLDDRLVDHEVAL